MSRFDTPIDRRTSDSIKWGKYAGRDVLPLWVADMDFAAPPAVIETLHRRIEHGVFGYGGPWPSLTESVLTHLESEYEWRIEPEWIVWLPGLVTGLNVACRAVDGEVLTATPIYPPFLSAPHFSGRQLNRVELACADQGWVWDQSALQQATTPATKLFLLCHPHNPVGRCWSRAELLELAAFAEANDLIVCSDEIHCGLILDADKRHIPFASLSPAAAKRSITLMAPSKTFNIPGLGCAFAVIPDARLRHRFEHAMHGIVPHVNVLGLAACEAAYRDCGDWHRELIAYLAGNRDRVQATVNAANGARMQRVEATYLAWIDVRELGLANPAAHFEAHGLGLSDGADFGAPGWLRLNFGCPRSTLDEALQRFTNACRAA
ncbi:MalY/PatB family protein [Ferribacterium limneticum]|uniref:MalY/PatB family protein n=1 Tax=Ferribacterium limneticum TaxID=76259 RepID=UPI001CFBD81E|nr:PatB family C-S lyase [Ferribacterium limneticum]UCV28461.1 PatB family C-S lyase [Ferribacterium limneticum]UCV32378.1 PatB family C-S lyase [Ferribacterium limneticum]